MFPLRICRLISCHMLQVFRLNSQSQGLTLLAGTCENFFILTLIRLSGSQFHDSFLNTIWVTFFPCVLVVSTLCMIPDGQSYHDTGTALRLTGFLAGHRGTNHSWNKRCIQWLDMQQQGWQEEKGKREQVVHDVVDRKEAKESSVRVSVATDWSRAKNDEDETWRSKERLTDRPDQFFFPFLQSSSLLTERKWEVSELAVQQISCFHFAKSTDSFLYFYQRKPGSELFTPLTLLYLYQNWRKVGRAADNRKRKEISFLSVFSNEETSILVEEREQILVPRVSLSLSPFPLRLWSRDRNNGLCPTSCPGPSKAGKECREV